MRETDAAIAYDLLAKGYFPKELPPSFSSVDFANKMVGLVGPMPTYAETPPVAKLYRHSISRPGQLRRALGVPHPLHQLRLCLLIAKNWDRLTRIIHASPFGRSQPMLGGHRAVAPGDAFLPELRAQLRASARFVVQADIARFYPSVYTHSLAWAVHGKTKAKQNQRNDRLLGNRLDFFVRTAQDGQTVGVPIGPDTSSICAELVASAIDQELARNLRGLRGLRFVDDYEFGCANRDSAERVLDHLQIALGEFELAVNPLKTDLRELPQALDEPWKAPLRNFRFRDGAAEQRGDLVAYFDLAQTLARQAPDKTVIAYAIGRVGRAELERETWPLLEKLLVPCLLTEPSTASLVFQRLAAAYRDLHELDLEVLGMIANQLVVDHAPLNHSNEVSWGLWASLVFGLPLSKASANAVSKMADSAVAISALHAERLGLFAKRLDTSTWRERLTPEELSGDQWLMAYECGVRGWLKAPGGKDHIGADARWAWLRDLEVRFYDEEGAAPIPSPRAQLAKWEIELASLVTSRLDQYGSDEDEDDMDEVLPLT